MLNINWIPKIIFPLILQNYSTQIELQSLSASTKISKKNILKIKQINLPFEKNYLFFTETIIIKNYICMLSS